LAAYLRLSEQAYLLFKQVVSDAIALHSINPQNIESEVRKELLKRYYDMFGGLEMAKTVIEQMVEIVRYGAAARAG
jgi:type I restriction enzyme R subunit